MKIFLSYSKRNGAAARLLASRLEQDGLSVWWDHELAAGEEYDLSIEAELLNADKVIVLWSSASVVSRWVRSEADHAAQKGKLVPILIEDVDIPIAFRLFHFIAMPSLGHNQLNEAEYADLVRMLPKSDLHEPVQPPQRLTGIDYAERSAENPKISLGGFTIIALIAILAILILGNVWRQVL